MFNLDESNINFMNYFRQLPRPEKIIPTSVKTDYHIELAMRAKFVKQGVIDFEKDSMMESILNQVIKDNEIEALIDILQNNCFPLLIEFY